MKYQCRQMLKQGGGAIVNTSSIMGLVSKTGLSAYSAAKSGVIGLTRSVALDYANAGIRVNAICPGGISTPMTTNPDIRESMGRVVAATPMGRMGDAREIADAVLWLCSDKASYITGQAIAVDGGYTVI
jgi:NAD(P)-dependent dehydrogenase (short-subunit alcohol dehydrogenase family)